MRVEEGIASRSRPPPMPSAREADGFRALQADASDVVSALWARKGLIVATTMVFLAAALLFLIVTTPLYKSTAQVFIDPRSKQVLQGEVTPTGLGTSSAGADTVLVDTQAEIIGSFPILAAVVDKEHLATDPEFGAVKREGLRKTLSDIFHAVTGTPATSPDARDVAIEKLQKLLLIKRVGNTYVIDVSMFSNDRQKSARIANAIANTFLASQATATSASTRETTQSLSARLDDLRKKMNEADAKVEAYRKANNLYGTQGVLLDDRRLQDYNDRIVAARTQVEAAKARYDQAQKLAQRGADATGTSVSLDTLALTALQTKLQDIDRQLARPDQQYGPRYPGMRDIRAERARTARQLAAEINDRVVRAKSDYQLASVDLASITTSFDQLKTVAAQNNEAQVGLRDLQGNAAAAKAIYDTVLARAKQSEEQVDLPTGNFRIISAAIPALRVSYPPAPLIFLAALVAGILTGSLLAWVRYVASAERPLERRYATSPLA